MFSVHILVIFYFILITINQLAELLLTGDFMDAPKNLKQLAVCGCKKCDTNRCVCRKESFPCTGVYLVFSVMVVLDTSNNLCLGACGCSSSDDCKNPLNGHTFTLSGICPDKIN